MRRAITVVVALSLLLLPALAQPPRREAAVEAVELLVNGDFEASTTDPWRVLGDSLVMGDTACPPRPGSAGSNAAALTVPADYGYIEQTVAVAPGGAYEFSGYFVSPDAPGGSEVRLQVFWHDQAGNRVGRSERRLAHPPSTSEYQLLTAQVPAEPRAHFAWIRIELALPPPPSTTTLCLDDLSFSGPPPPPAMPTPTVTDTPVATPSSTATSTVTPEPTAVPIAMGSLLNGGFEEAAADGVPIGWRKFGGILTHSSAFARSGSYSGAFISESDTTKWAYQVVGVEPNQAYAFEGYVLMNGSPGSLAYLRVSWYASADASGQLVSNADSPDDLSGSDPSFRHLSTGAVVAPGDAHSAKLRVMLAPGSSAGETIFLDDFAFSETEPPTATPVPTSTPSPTLTPSPTSTSVPAVTTTAVARAAASPTAIPIAVGSLLNGSFEEAAADGVPIGWQKFGRGALSRSSASARSGSYSGAFTSQSDTTKWAYQVVAVEPDQAYAFEGYVMMNGPPDSLAYLRVSWYASADGSGQLLSNADSPNDLSGSDPSFRHLSTGAVVAPGDAHSAKLRVVLSPASAASETIYLDDFSFSPWASPPSGAAPAEEAPPSGPAPQTSASTGPAAAPSRRPPRPASDSVNVQESPHKVKISEVCYDTGNESDDPAHEWLELYNSGSKAVELGGWSLVDNTSRDLIPSASLEPGAYVVVAAGPHFEVDYPAYSGLLLFVSDGRIGNGLANQGDRLLLLDGEGRRVDALSYADDDETFQPPAPAVASGHCLERTPASYDSDTATDFRDSPIPSPGVASQVLRPPETPTATVPEGVSSVRGVSSTTGSAEQSGGPPWPWILAMGLLFVAGAGAGASIYRMRARSGRRL